MRRTPVTLALTGLLAAPLFTGCWDRTEVNDIGIVMASSFDLEDDGKYRASLQFALPGNMGGGGGSGGGSGGGDKKFYVDSEVGRTVREANFNLQKRLPRRLFFAHRRVVVIGEKIARQGIRPLFDVLSRVPENRLSADISIAKGRGADVLNAESMFERYSGESMREILESENILNVSLKDVAQQLAEEGVDPFIALFELRKQQEGKQGASQAEVVGYCQFKDDKLVDVLKGAAAEGLPWLKQQFQPYVTTVRDERNVLYTVNIYRGTSRVKPILKPGGQVHYDIKIELATGLLEVAPPEDMSKIENLHGVEHEVEKHVKQAVELCFKQIQAKRADSAGLGLILARKYPKIWLEQYKDRWYDVMDKATFNVTVTAHAERLGLTSENIATKERKKE